MSDDGLFTFNAAQQRYEYHVNGHIAFARIRREEGRLFIDYVEAPPALRGTGAASALMQHLVAQAEQDNVTPIPICGYAVSWMQRHAKNRSSS